MSRLSEWIERHSLKILISMLVVEVALIGLVWYYCGVFWAGLVGAAFVLIFIVFNERAG